MFLFKKKPKAPASDLPAPQTQVQEVLYLLLTQGDPLTRADFFELAHVLNAPEAIRKLRRAGYTITTETVKVRNKFGRPVSYCRYILNDRHLAKIKYLRAYNSKDKRNY